MKSYTLQEIAEHHGVSRQAVAYQAGWRGLGRMADGKTITLTEKEVSLLVFRRPNKKKYVRKNQSVKKRIKK